MLAVDRIWMKNRRATRLPGTCAIASRWRCQFFGPIVPARLPVGNLNVTYLKHDLKSAGKPILRISSCPISFTSRSLSTFSETRITAMLCHHPPRDAPVSNSRDIHGGFVGSRIGGNSCARTTCSPAADCIFCVLGKVAR